MFITDKVIGHRGASAYAPENTLESFDKARELGCRCIEFDVVQSSDGELFIFHDKMLNRTTNGVGKVSGVPSSYLKSLDAGAWFSGKFCGVKIPTFKDAILWLDKNNMQGNIEIKPAHGYVLQTTKAVVSHIEKYWPNGKLFPLVSSLNYEALLLCHKLNPRLPLGLLLDTWPDNWLELAKRIKCTSINLSKQIATKKRVAEIINNGFQVYIYTVNRRMIAKKYLNWGVGGVFSDHPDLLIKIDWISFLKNKYRYALHIFKNRRYVFES
ncbi:MAG: glycerophosphoryl diester phosphodiesterase [Legionellaceae bacterium]|nr:glycerophosphoryl diester phosphodiesterase [Legionellaceae bacterium]